MVAQQFRTAFGVSADGGVSEGLVLGGWVAFVLGDEWRCPAPVELGLCAHALRHLHKGPVAAPGEQRGVECLVREIPGVPAGTAGGLAFTDAKEVVGGYNL